MSSPCSVSFCEISVNLESPFSTGVNMPPIVDDEYYAGDTAFTTTSVHTTNKPHKNLISRMFHHIMEHK